jgi:hypothetical protein
MATGINAAPPRALRRARFISPAKETSPMPRLKNESSVLVDDLKARIDRLVDAAVREGRDRALGEIRALVGGGLPVRRGPGRPPKSASAPTAGPGRPRKKRRNPWASMTPEQRADRVKKMLAGRGLKPKNAG